MAAGQGFKTFATGDVLTAADTNGYLMQGVWVFASAAARDAAVTSPQEGNFCYLKDTNATQYYTGSAWTAIGGSSGKVLQVLSSFNTSTFSTTNTTFTDVTSLSVTITPSAASSKIKLTGIVSFGHSADVYTVTRFMRDATAIGIADTAGSRSLTTSGNYQGNAGTVGSVVQVPLNYIDSPSSTSAITYKIQVAQNSAGTLYVNRSSQDSDSASNIRAISSLIVEEIGA